MHSLLRHIHSRHVHPAPRPSDHYVRSSRHVHPAITSRPSGHYVTSIRPLRHVHSAITSRPRRTKMLFKDLCVIAVTSSESECFRASSRRIRLLHYPHTFVVRLKNSNKHTSLSRAFLYLAVSLVLHFRSCSKTTNSPAQTISDPGGTDQPMSCLMSVSSDRSRLRSSQCTSERTPSTSDIFSWLVVLLLGKLDYEHQFHFFVMSRTFRGGITISFSRNS
jgi:hypothetical protein